MLSQVEFATVLQQTNEYKKLQIAYASPSSIPLDIVSLNLRVTISIYDWVDLHFDPSMASSYQELAHISKYGYSVVIHQLHAIELFEHATEDSSRLFLEDVGVRNN